MDLETVIQSEVCQKEKNKYIILRICGIQKNSTDELICKAEIETQMWRTNMDTKDGSGGGMNWEAGINIYTLLQINNENIQYSTGNSTQSSKVT